MNVEERLSRYSQTVARHLEGIDQSALLDRICAAIQAADLESPLVNCGGSSRVAPTVRELVDTSGDTTTTGHDGGIEQELHRLQEIYEKKGEHSRSAALRIALLLEGANASDQALAWWYRAAELGDRDAIDYLAVLMEEEDVLVPFCSR